MYSHSGPLKTPQLTHTALQDTIMQRASNLPLCHHFDKYLKSGPFLARKQKFANDSVDNSQQGILTRKLRRKYLGRKVRHLSRQNQTIILTHYSKYINNLTWTQQCSSRINIQNHKMEYPIENYLFVMSLRDFVMLDQDIRLTCKDIFKLILACHRNTSIRLNNYLSITMSKWDKMPSYAKKLVKHLCLDLRWDHNHPSDYLNRQDWLKGFGQLNSFILPVARDSTQPSPDLFTSLLQTKSLNTLELAFDFQYSFRPPFVAELYDQIEANNIPKWHIRVRFSIDNLMQEKYDALLSRIDCLALGKVRPINSFGNPPDFTYNSGPVRVTYGFSDLKYMHAKRKKIFELVTAEHTKFDIADILNRCKSLEGLYIKANAYQLTTIYNESKISEPQANSWTSNLKDVVLSFTQSSLNEPAFQVLFSKIKRECLNLETLEVFSSYNILDNEYDYEGKLSYTNLCFALQEPDFKGLEKLTSLQYLRIATTLDFTSIENIVSQLPNLKKLEVTLGDPEDYRSRKLWYHRESFKSFERLEELKINKVTSGSEEWGKEFSKNIQKLQGLRVLEIQDFTDDTISLRIFRQLVDGLISLKNIKKLILRVFVESEEELVKEEEVMLKEIKILIMRYIESENNLEEINISNLHQFGIERIKFTRY